MLYKENGKLWLLIIFVLMKVMIHKILALLMAVFMLASTVSWTIEKHYCFGTVVDVALFHEADTCGMDMGSLNDRIKLDKDSNSCCSDEIIFVPGQDDLKMSYHDLDLDQQFFLVAFAGYYLDLFQPVSQPLVPHAHYPPPILVKDIHILDQVFLI
ncbi:hypothetical protein [Arenibacter sp. F20364]|uniref:HYC_CC_PP family protein n=1 Tax=Arenibacter sp. F20364 TaxID=2926415 RepID=UPI001FF6C7B4|nr:hypothetical protein [Arenibacter sp. F20364]MCK0191003.1 hypothetical protein [Arenibacter sp. F20364]